MSDFSCTFMKEAMEDVDAGVTVGGELLKDLQKLMENMSATNVRSMT